MNIDFLLGAIVSAVGVFLAELIGRSIRKAIKSQKFSLSKSPTIEIGDKQFELKGLPIEKKREFDLLSSTIIIQNPETGFPAGTGFIINEKNAITTFHVVQIAAENPEKFVNTKFAITGDIYHAKVVEVFMEQDIAIIEFDTPLPTGVSPLEIESGELTTGNKFRTFGYGGRDSIGLWAKGEIMGLMQDDQSQKRIQLSSSQIISGMSGAPIIDTQSQKVVGILTATSADREKSRPDTIAFATPINAAILKNVNLLAKSGTTKRAVDGGDSSH